MSTAILLTWTEKTSFASGLKLHFGGRGKVRMFTIRYSPMTHRGDPAGKHDTTPWVLVSDLPQVKTGDKFATVDDAMNMAQKRWDRWLQVVMDDA